MDYIERLYNIPLTHASLAHNKSSFFLFSKMTFSTSIALLWRKLFYRPFYLFFHRKISLLCFLFDCEMCLCLVGDVGIDFFETSDDWSLRHPHFERFYYLKFNLKPGNSLKFLSKIIPNQKSSHPKTKNQGIIRQSNFQ